jgi:type IV secretory pathway VirD2 relaxase
VRVTYSPNSVKGRWRAHGRYLERDSATGEGASAFSGFEAQSEGIEVASRLAEWEKAGDERLWKLIISPEFGERVDLKKLARETLQRMENDLGTPLQWVAVSHFNTEHPHVHIALRGIDCNGKTLRLERDYIKHGIRDIASELCTNQLGYWTEMDSELALRKEVDQQRFTSLDRNIQRRATQSVDRPDYFEVAIDQDGFRARSWAGLQDSYVARRLLTLQAMGLATRVGPADWAVKNDFETVLRSMQQVRDRQKTLAAHGAAISDDRLPIRMLSFRHAGHVEGRVLVHGEEEGGRPYLMLEGTDATIHHIYYTPEMEEARASGLMRTNSFVRFRMLRRNGKPILEIDDLGDSEALLKNRRYFRDAVKQQTSGTSSASETSWGGWLGRYQTAILHAGSELAAERDQREREKARGQGR